MLSEGSLQCLACSAFIKEAAQLWALSTPRSTKWSCNHTKLLDFEVHSTTTELGYDAFPVVTFRRLRQRPFSVVQPETIPKLSSRLPGLPWCQGDARILHRAEEHRFTPPVKLLVHSCPFCEAGVKNICLQPLKPVSALKAWVLCRL